MRFRYLKSLILAAAAFAIVGCNQEGDTINRVQTNLVAKNIFEGEWWTLQSVVDADGDATLAGSGASLYMFSGGSAFTDLALDSGQSATMGKIRWVVDEDFLYAYRSYELIDGGNDDGRDPTFRGQPFAAFAIEDHVDIRREYSALTGEVTNVLVENTSDRRWYEREFMRVDWSMNHAQSFAYLTDWVDFGSSWQHESAAFIQEEGSHPDFPESYAPQFVRVAEDPEYRFADEWPAEMADTVHYMSFTTMTMFSPGGNCLLIGSNSICQTVSVPVRTAFLRVPPNHEYAAATQSHQQFDRFGLFRTYQRTYVRGGQDPESLRERCSSDADCASGGYCDLERNICDGGLTSDYGETDFMTFYRPRHNFFRNSLTDTTCRADWECNGLYPDTPGADGSVCDRAARRCTVPLRERDLRPVTYHLNDGFPKHLVKTAFETVGNWNEAFMRGWRAVQDRTIPDYASVRMTPQTDNPTAYCFEGSPDVGPDGTCAGKYNPFMAPSEWEAMGVAEPYDCQIVNTAGWDEPANPSSYDEYPMPDAYRWEFQGEECMFFLQTNACDWWRTEPGTHCDAVTDENGDAVAWQQQGDIRYQFFNYIDQIGTRFGGVSELRADPTSGELITADANYAGIVGENMAFVATEWFPVIRCTSDEGCAPGEEGAAERWLGGENFRDYFEAVEGRSELPIQTAPSGSDGFTTDDFGRPALPVGDLRAAMAFDRVEESLPKIETLRGEDARFNIFQDRLRNLEGTSFESQMMEALGSQAMNAHFANTNLATTDVDPGQRVMDEDVLDRISPFRGNNMVREIGRDREIQQRAGMLGYDFMNLTDPRSFLRSRYWEYWAEAFRGRPLGEASIRLQQMQMKAVQHHEVGHSVGLRHNFGGSFDRNNYGEGYFNLVLNEGLELPRIDDYDLDGSDFVEADELEQYYADLREVRNERARRGAHNYMTGSIMDYNGDRSDVYGLGKYDVAATIWNYFDKVEAYEGDPRVENVDPLFNPLLDSANTGRRWMTTYAGGESCNVDTDCPFQAGSAALAEGQPISQRCVRHPRYTRLPEPCDGDRNCICSNFDEDMRDYYDGVAYNNDVDGDGERDFWPVRYQFCGDERLNDISWCSAFDAGESFQEAIDHYRRNWYEGYASNYYRRFRRSGPRTAVSFGSVVDAAKIYQHLFFRLFFEPGFGANSGDNSGPLGFDDQWSASVDSMHWLIELINLPQEGSYQFDAERNAYTFLGEEMDMPGADMVMEPGQGFGMWTEFQDGHQGFFRAEKSGVFWDKFYALFALAIRDWGLNFTIDERYFINYYDLFAVPMTEVFGGIAIDDARWFAPRVDDEDELVNMAFYRGLGLGECQRGRLATPCEPERDLVYPEPAIEGTTNTVLRNWATILALAQFPVFYDSSFEQRLIVFRLGEGTGHDIPDVQPDGSPACALGEAIDPSHNVVDPGVDDGCNTLEDATYVVYNSERLHTPYVAVKVRPRLSYNLEEEQLGFQLLSRLIALQARVNELEGGSGTPAEIEAARIELQEQESFLENLIQLQAQYGISNYFGI
ncbi:MAG TPA: hypothetical protein RMH85_09045 [Polyangiaceae bacterium LLY-WYZ-15_(1-7)]|nr:hypothetical protein [Myxococcales bacterium]MAT28547.1 hypothetical protein [Sandaracinus sp.]HJK91468.1 hypothetical protein [Polyangiaceae bacterium LLY-WYZ-15_(1-7)]HJL01591.1 hypothetical protein [Polyangiaceae bacterium LLY-WYZ-15_(1-7)]HJL08631.1 hypothetical protein [Polyangiaceae bacterium LLY-WYZ-15_(1-7)]